MKIKILGHDIIALLVCGFVFFTILLSFGCEEEEKIEDIKLKAKQDSIVQLHKDSIERARLETEYAIKYPKINYTVKIPADRKELAELLSKNKNPRDSANKYKVLTTLNRKELRFLSQGQKIIVPDTVLNDVRAYSVFPQYYWGARKLPKLIIVSNKYQAYACYEKGILTRFAATNTGKEITPTFPGRYSLVWKERNHKSSLDSDWIMPFNFNFHAQAGNAFHQFVMPGRPVSHSCCRQFMDDAEWLFKWGKGADHDKKGKFVPNSGTPVLMLGIFDFSRKRGGPWLDLKSTKDSLLVLPEDPMAVEEALIPIVQIPIDSRGSLKNIQRFRTAEDILRAKGIIRPGVKLTETKNYNKVRRQKQLAEQKAKLAKEKQSTAKTTDIKVKTDGSTYLKEMENTEKKINNPKKQKQIPITPKESIQKKK